MKSFEYVITSPDGLDVHPAGLLTKEAVKYRSAIFIHRGQNSANAKSLLNLLQLGIKCGDTVRVTIEGEDEVSAAPSIEKFFKANL